MSVEPRTPLGPTEAEVRARFDAARSAGNDGLAMALWPQVMKAREDAVREYKTRLFVLTVRDRAGTWLARCPDR
jgi:hypothetical protein